MSRMQHIDFVLLGKADGVVITPENIGFSQFNVFNKQVEEFLAGSQNIKLNDVRVDIKKGSYLLRTLVPVVLYSAVQTDLKSAKDFILDGIDVKRAEVIQKWQEQSKKTPKLSIEIRPDGHDRSGIIKINHSTNYHYGQLESWVAVEKYLYGQIVDMGGAHNANIHLKIKAKTLIVATSQEFLRDQKENKLYHNVMLRVKAEQNINTKELRSVSLISFEEYKPVYDEKALNHFASVGKKAWADVPNAVKWVRQTRG